MREDSLHRVGLVVLVGVASLLQIADQAVYLGLLAVVAAAVGVHSLTRERLLPPPPPLAAALLWCLMGLFHLLLVTASPYQGKMALARRGTQVGALATGILAVSVPGGVPALEGVLLATGALHGGVASWDSLQGRRGRAHWYDRARFSGIRGRVSGLFPNPNLLGFYLALCLPLALAWAAEDDRVRRLAGSGALLLLTAGLGLTYSRSAWLAAGCGVVALILTRPRGRRGVLIGPLLAALVVVALATPGLLDRAVSTGERREFGIDQRVKLLRGVARMVAAAPVTGHGPGTFHSAYPGYRLVGGQYPFDAHSQYLQELVETGLPGLAIFLLMIASALRSCWRCVAEDPEERVARSGRIGALTVLAVGCLFASPLAYSPLAVPAMLLLGAGAGPDRSRRGAGKVTFGRGTNVLLALFAAYGALAAGASLRAEQERLVVRRGVRGVAGLEPGPELRKRLGEGLVPDLLERLDWAEFMDPGAPEHRLLEGELLLGMGLQARAEQSFLEVLARDPRESLAWSQISRTLEARGELDRAVSALDHALALDPFSEALLNQKAGILRLQGKLEAAAELLGQALRTNPAFLGRNRDTYPRVLRTLIGIRVAQGREDEAEGLRQLLSEIEAGGRISRVLELLPPPSRP